MELMKSRVSERIGLKELASSCNVSQAHFCRIFKRYTSQTAMEYVNQFRLHKAEVDLLSSKNSLSEIAERNGFFDLSHFSRYYKKMRGYFTNKALLLAVESRTSSPVRIPRDKETLQHVSLPGIYPCGEGAGYAGGIVSSALDGVNCALKIKGIL